MWFRNPKKVEYQDIFTGSRKKHGLKSCPGSCPSLKKGMLEVGKLVVGAKEGGLVCEVPKKGCKECNKESDEFCFKHTEVVDVGRSGLIKSKKRPARNRIQTGQSKGCSNLAVLEPVSGRFQPVLGVCTKQLDRVGSPDKIELVQ